MSIGRLSPEVDGSSRASPPTGARGRGTPVSSAGVRGRFRRTLLRTRLVFFQRRRYSSDEYRWRWKKTSVVRAHYFCLSPEGRRREEPFPSSDRFKCAPWATFYKYKLIFFRYQESETEEFRMIAALICYFCPSLPNFMNHHITEATVPSCLVFRSSFLLGCVLTPGCSLSPDGTPQGGAFPRYSSDE